jgi:hypothetical protein
MQSRGCDNRKFEFKLTARDCSVDFLQNPNMAPKSSDRHNTSKPDGYLLMKDRVREDTVSWADVVLSCEYKREDGNEELDDVSIHQDSDMLCYIYFSP